MMLANRELVDNHVHMDGAFYERPVYQPSVYQPNRHLVDGVSRHLEPSENSHSLPSVYLLSFRIKEEEKRESRGEAPEVLPPTVDKMGLVDGEGAE